MVNTSVIQVFWVRMCREQAGGDGAEGSILGERGRRVCVEPHVLILIRIEYERQAETQLVTSELAPCYLREHMPSASSSATRRPPPSSQLNETGGGASFWAGDTTQGPIFNKTKHSHLPPPPNQPPAHGYLQPPLFPSVFTLRSLILQIGSAQTLFRLHCPWKG